VINAKGKRRTFWVSTDMDQLIEETRKKLRMSRSNFYRYAAVRLLQELSVLTTKAHEKEVTIPEVEVKNVE
jgi:hypothetical protein